MKKMNKLPMTAAGHAALEDELSQRIRGERPRLVRRIQDAIADDSNLAENSEYHATKVEQELNEARIAELEDKLARAELIDVSKLSGSTIKFGATVTQIEEDIELLANAADGSHPLQRWRSARQCRMAERLLQRQAQQYYPRHPGIPRACQEGDGIL
jgi:hypothetical protein